MMDKEEMEPMMEKQEEEKKNPNEHYEEKRECCGCCTTKCMVITFCIFLILDFLFEVLHLYVIGTNKYFEPTYLYVYVFLVFVLFIAVILVCYYLFAPDSRETRAVVPWAFLIAGITGVLIALWIITYIFFMYPKQDVWVTGMDDDRGGKQYKKKNDDSGDGGKKSPDDIDDDYSKQSKPLYVFDHALSPLLFGLAFILYFFSVKGWVERHENQDKAHG